MIAIKNWRETFENADTRKRQRLAWFYCPSGCDSRGYRLLMREGKDGLAALGLFQALCQITATMRAEDRGIFRNSDGTGMEPADLWEITRTQPADFQQALALLVSVGWITVDNEVDTENLPPICHQSADNLPLSADNLPQGEGEGEGEGEGKGKGNGKGKEVAVAPLPFDSEPFARCWENWRTHRRELKKPLTPTSESQQLKRMAELGEIAAIAAIEHSIANCYQGIFEPNNQNGNASQNSTKGRLPNRNIGTLNDPSEYRGL